MSISPQETLANLLASPVYKNWKEENPKSYLTHFFAQVDAKFSFKEEWEIGFFNQADNKITVFTAQDQQFMVKPAEPVFQEKTAAVEKLDLKTLKIDLNSALETFQNNFNKLFEKEVLGDGFIILQVLEKKPVWNFTFITKTIKFVNLKINAQEGSICFHTTVDLVDKKLDPKVVKKKKMEQLKRKLEEQKK